MDKRRFCSMMVVLVSVFAALAFGLAASAQASWSNYYAGSYDESLLDALPLADGGYLAMGWTRSSGAGGYDGWLVRTGSSGDVIWQKAYGGPLEEAFYKASEMEDGGFIVLGYTSSYGAGDDDVWVLRLTGTGTIVWQKTYGGPGEDYVGRFARASDGGFVFAGYRKLPPEQGGEDIWIFKIDTEGRLVWQKTFGAGAREYANDILAVSDGYLVAAEGYLYQPPQIFDVTYLLKLDGSGNILWQRRYASPGSIYKYPYGITPFPGGGYFLWGVTYENGGQSNAWLARVDEGGNFYWEKTLGTPYADYMIGAAGMPEGGVVLAGYNYPTDNYTDAEGWIAKLDGSGNLLWQHNGGMTGWDILNGVSVTNDGGLMFAGRLSIGAPNHGWLIKLGSDGSMDPSCTFGKTSNAVLQNASSTISSISLDTLTTIEVEGISSATAFTANALPTFLCASTGQCVLQCVAAVPGHAILPERIRFSASVGMEHCQDVATFLWNFGDGNTSTQSAAFHQYAAPGVYTWHVTATGDGASCSKEGTITVVDPPVVTTLKKVAPPFKIVAMGSKFQNGVKVYIDGVEWPSVVWKKAEKVQITGGASLKAAVPKGVSKVFRFVNPDGGETSFVWNW